MDEMNKQPAEETQAAQAPVGDVFAKAEELQRKAEAKKKKAQEKADKKALRAIRKKEKRAALKEYPTFSVTKNFVFYLCFFVFALIFTQALRSPLSSVLFIFVILLPWVMLLYLLTAIVNLRDSNASEAETVQKGVPLEYEIMLANDGWLPYPYAEADILYPSSGGVRCDVRRASFQLAPMGVYRIRDKAVFHYRGSYDIGVRDIYVYDLLKLFRLRLRRDNLRPIFVMPRRLALLTDGQGAASEINTTEVRNMRGQDRTELTEIKEYQMGDGLRDIHWKLSSKTQDLMVKHYGMNACRSVYYLPDLAEGYTDPLKKGLYEPDINQYCADAVTEMTIALILAALRGDSNIATLLWYDRRAAAALPAVETAAPETDEKSGLRLPHLPAKEPAPQIGYAAEVMYNELDFERVYPYFATAALHSPDLRPGSLCRFITETESVSYYIVTSRLDGGLVQALQEDIRDYSSVVLSGGLEVYYFNPQRKIRDPAARREKEEYDEQLIGQLRASGIIVHSFDSLD
ncbi:MAG: DUF58 domain-containing protein [Clostridia bacterium]|nr:DUF58 domain-containing protein [Clostridia bacterium]